MEVVNHKREKMQVVKRVKSFFWGVVIFVGSASFGLLGNDQEAYRLLNENFSAKNYKTFKINRKTIPFPREKMERRNLFDLDTFNKEFTTWNLSAKPRIDLLDTMLRQSDLDQIAEQISNKKSFELEKSALNIDDAILLSEEEVEQFKQLPFPSGTMYEVSWPVFSDDKRFAVIYEKQICGVECGGGQLNFFYKNIESEWETLGILPMNIN